MACRDGSLLASLMSREEEAEKLDLNLDSGATIHMVRDSSFVREPRDLTEPITIEVADGFQVLATSKGNIDTEYIKIEDVYVVPGLKMNLISVNQLARSCDIFTTFGKNSAELFKEGERVGGAIAVGGLYKLRFLVSTAPRGHIASYAPNAASSSYMKEDLVPSFKDRAFQVDWVMKEDLVPSFKDRAFQVDWVMKEDLVPSFKDRAFQVDWVMKEALVPSFKDRAFQVDWVMKEDLVPSFKDRAFQVDWVTGIEGPAVPVNWVTSFEHKSLICGDWFALTAEMDESSKTGAAACCNMIKDGVFCT